MCSVPSGSDAYAALYSPTSSDGVRLPTSIFAKTSFNAVNRQSSRGSQLLILAFSSVDHFTHRFLISSKRPTRGSSKLQRAASAQIAFGSTTCPNGFRAYKCVGAHGKTQFMGIFHSDQLAPFRIRGFQTMQRHEQGFQNISTTLSSVVYVNVYMYSNAFTECIHSCLQDGTLRNPRSWASRESKNMGHQLCNAWTGLAPGQHCP